MIYTVRKRSEVERDEASRFAGEQYRSNGYFSHSHRNMEIYGVVKGSVLVTIEGQQEVLTDGQIAVINGLENHGYEINGKAEIFFLHIGTRYLSNLTAAYPQKRLPRWLMDAQYNQQLYQRFCHILNKKEPVPELRRIGITCQLFADIIERYGVLEKQNHIRKDSDIVAEVIQYIYDHYQENITLESLGKIFYLSPKAFSKKLRKRLNVDLRVFINDVRVQMVIQFRNDPQYKEKTLQQIAMLCGFTSMSTFYRSYERNFKSRRITEESKPSG